MDFDFIKGILFNLLIIYAIISCLLVISIVILALFIYVLPYTITTLADIFREILIIVADWIKRFMELK